jgi:AraC-like DNA-binding protein
VNALRSATPDAVGHDVAKRVRKVVGGLIEAGAGSPDIQVVAEAMGTTVRTLQRRLHGSGLTYGGVLQEVRYAAARHLLQNERRTIGEIALALGYSDHAHFTRAFLRWTGLTPRAFRLGRRPADDLRSSSG